MKSNIRNTKLFLSFFISMLYAVNLFSNYSVSEIPDELKKNARTVVRVDDAVFEIKSKKEAKITYHKVLTILNKNGLKDADFMAYYDDFTRIPNNIKIIIYDERGNKVKKASKSDIFDYQPYTGVSVTDVRAKSYEPETSRMPFTIEYTYTEIHKGLLYYPAWSPYDDDNISVLSSTFTVMMPEDMNLRYKEMNLSKGVDKSTLEGVTTYKWEAKNLPALTSEPYSSPNYDYLPVVMMAPADFEIDGFTGNAGSWEDFGKWVYELNSGKDILPEETQAQIKELVKDASGDYEKIKILYEYMQNKTRYVSIQLGIGGWQPFSATITDKYSYGDCKALSMYMHALLKYAGISSYYTLVRATSSALPIITDFPAVQFNHAFLCVPNNGDTIWLECTSQKNPFGYLGSFTDDRDVLLISEEGGKMVHTRSYSMKENQVVRNASVSITEQGSCNASVFTKYSGIRYEPVNYLISLDDVDKKKVMYRRMGISNFKLENYNHELVKQEVPYINESLDLIVRDYASKVGDRMIVQLNMLNRITDRPKSNKNRMSDIMVRRETIDMDTITYIIPDGYIIDKIPANVEIKSAYGTYSASIKQKENTVEYVRVFALNKGTHPVEQYDDFVDFFNQICSADDAKIILKRESL